MSDQKHGSTQALTDLLAELKAEYLIALPGKIAKLKLLTEKAEWGELSEEYHKMKGTGKTYGYPEVSLICEKMEFLAQHHHGQQQALFKQALEVLERVRQSYEDNVPYDLKADSSAQLILRLKTV